MEKKSFSVVFDDGEDVGEEDDNLKEFYAYAMKPGKVCPRITLVVLGIPNADELR